MTEIHASELDEIPSRGFGEREWNSRQSRADQALAWVEAMEKLGWHIDYCDQMIDDVNQCGGPMLTTEDSAECYLCGHESHRRDIEQDGEAYFLVG